MHEDVTRPPLSFSRREMDRRRHLIHGLIETRGLDALLVYGQGRYQSDIQWATNWPGGREGYCLIPGTGEPVLLVEFFNHLGTARRLSDVHDVRWEGPDPAVTLGDLLEERGMGRGAVGVAGALPFAVADALRSRLPGLRLAGVSQAYRDLRLVRSEEEILRFRYAAHLTDLSMEALGRHLCAGLFEDALAAIIERPYLEGGGYAGIHYTAAQAMAGPFIPVPSQYPPHRALEDGDVLTTEITGCYGGYPGQIHRTYSLGRAPDRAWSRLHEAAREAFLQVKAALRPHAPVEAIWEAASFIENEGFTIIDDLVHGGDQLPPVMQTPAAHRGRAPGVREILPGMVVVVQPNLVDAEGRGLQFGETLLVTEEGPVSLHRYPREWTVVRPA